MKTWFALSLLLISFSFRSMAAEDKSLTLRVQGYVEAMMSGERSSLLRVKDFYGRIYLTKKATVVSVTKQTDGNYIAELQFETTGWIEQNAEVPPVKQSSSTKAETLKRRITFKVLEKSLKMVVPLETPFVRKGTEKRYVLEIPSST